MKKEQIKKRGRGRPRKIQVEPEKIQVTPQQNESQSPVMNENAVNSDMQQNNEVENDNSYFDVLTGYTAEPEHENEQPQQQTEQTQQQNEPEASTTGLNTSWVTGYILLLVLDVAIPNLLAFLIFRKKKIDITKIQLTPKQLRELEPIADQAAKYLNLQINPLLVLIASMGAMYMNNAKKLM